MIKFFTLLLLSLSLAACEFISGGTNTGNPELASDTPPPSSADEQHYEGALKLGFMICAKIKNCHPESNLNVCVNQVFVKGNYTVELGSTAASYSNLNNLRNAELNQQILPNQTNFINCVQALETLACSDPLAQTAYAISNGSDFSGTNILFRSSGACTQIY